MPVGRCLDGKISVGIFQSLRLRLGSDIIKDLGCDVVSKETPRSEVHYEVHYGGRALTDRNVRKFDTFPKANEFAKTQEAKMLYVDMFRVDTTVIVKTIKLSE